MSAVSEAVAIARLERLFNSGATTMRLSLPLLTSSKHSKAVCYLLLCLFAAVHFLGDFQRVENLIPPSSKTTKTHSSSHPPLSLFEQYKREHSVSALELELNSSTNDGRKYSVAYYSCPHRAGNMLLSFFNVLIWSVASNRTLLWAYDPTAKNSVKDCDGVLVRHSWIPGYEEWKDRLSLEEPVAVRMNTRRTKRTHGRLFAKREQRESLQAPQVVLFPQIPDLATNNQNISRISWWEDPQRMTRRSILNVYTGRIVLYQSAWRTLYARGIWFLYGMLFRHCFWIRHGNTDSDGKHSTTNANNNTPASISIGLHSRHMDFADDGSDISPEQKCLKRLLQRHVSRLQGSNTTSSSTSPCVVYAMSDRNATLEGLRTWLPQAYVGRCIVDLYNHTDSTSSPGGKLEHGPFAGAGFFYDLEHAARARTGVIGDFRRSSTVLMAALISYDRAIVEPREYSGSLQQCSLPRRKQNM